MSDPKYHDRHAAGIYRAIALRFYCRYVGMRHSAEHVGADVTATHGRLPSEAEVTDQYTAAVEEWLWERPATPRLWFAVLKLWPTRFIRGPRTSSR